MPLRKYPDTLIYSMVKERGEFIDELLLQDKPRAEIVEACPGGIRWQEG